MKNRITIFSFFAGAGFLDLGFEIAGVKIAFVNEIFKPFIEAYRNARCCLNLPIPEYGYYQGSAIDFLQGQQKSVLTNLVDKVRNNQDILGFIGGSPCPDFSVGGKNKGCEGDRGQLTSIYVEIVCQQKPDFFLFENVEGLWKTKKHRTFYEEVKQKFQDAGYITTERLINAIEYGVPQDRNRIILLGFRKELLIDMNIALLNNFELPSGVFPWERHIIYPKSKVFSCSWADKSPFQENSTMECPQNIIKELTVEYWFRKNDVNNHPNAKHYFKPRRKERFQSIEEGDDSRKSFKRLHRWRYSPTVCYGNNEVHLHPYKKRRISVAEALSLQSLPKEVAFPEHLSLTNMFKAIGNGVPFLAAKALALSIIDFLNQ